MKYLRVYCILFFCFFAAPNIFAQWKLVAQNAIPPVFRVYNGGGIITNHNGTLWAGDQNIWMSADTGKTWTVMLSLTDFRNLVKDIYFYDDNTGLATTQNGEIYITLDRGLSWIPHIPPHPYRNRPSIESACFAGTPNNIIACSYAGDRFISGDGGATWAVTIVDSFASKVIPGSGGTAYVIGGLFTGAWLYETNDFGATWIQHPAQFQWDSYSFARDECDTNIFYIANDDFVAKSDKFSRIFVTTNIGVTWDTSDTHSVPHHCGSVSTSSHAVFVQTFSGISRSTDQGLTWKDIGGPPNIEDTRFVTALNDNLIVAIDSFGSVWVTNNSGGDSLSYTDPNTLSILTSDEKTDTLGGSVAVPISLSRIISPIDVYLTIHYDQNLFYKGTYSLSNTRLDIPGEEWPGRSKIYIPDADSSGPAANALFDVFADSMQSYKVTIDSLQYCMKHYPVNATSIISPISGCGIKSIAHFLLDSLLPELSISPNPSSGEISLYSSANINEAQLIIYDMLGVKQGEKIISIGKNAPAKLSLPNANGVYQILVNTPKRIYNLRIIVEH